MTWTQLQAASSEELQRALAEALRGGWLKRIEQIRSELNLRGGVPQSIAHFASGLGLDDD